MTSKNDPFVTTRTLTHGHRVLPGRPESISNVRSLIRGVVGFAVVCEDALLVASEVATNAIRHSRSGEPRGTFSAAVEVRASGSRRTLRIEIGDLGPRRLVPDELCEVRPGDEGSRGLPLVDTLADRWGIQPTPTGKRVWLELDWKNGDETRTLPQQRR